MLIKAKALFKAELKNNHCLNHLFPIKQRSYVMTLQPEGHNYRVLFNFCIELECMDKSLSISDVLT